MFGFDIEDPNHYLIQLVFLFCAWNSMFTVVKFQEVNPSFQAYKNLVKIKDNPEYKIAKSRGKLSEH